MDNKKLLCGAAAFAVISQVVHTIGSIFAMGYYTDPRYFGFWSNLMMPGNSPPGADFFLASLAIGLITGAIFTYTYDLTKVALLARARKNFKANDPYLSGLRFGALLFLIASVPGFMSMWLLFALPLSLQFAWLLEGLVISLAFGIAVAKICR
jgi:hypothetical protein